MRYALMLPHQLKTAYYEEWPVVQPLGPLEYHGPPLSVGLDTLAASISEEGDTIMDVAEPYLLQLGFLDRTPRGRMATRAAYAHMNVPYTERPVQGGLFEG